MFKNCFEWLYPAPTIMECMQSLKDVERTLTIMDEKYTKDIANLRDELKRDIRSGQPKRHCMCKLRRIKLFEKNHQGYQMRLEACISKRLQLESLQVTRQHVDAIKQTTRTFKQYLRENDISKITEIQDSVNDMIEQAMEIQEVLGEESPLLVDDADLEEEFEKLLVETERNPRAPEVVELIALPVVTNTSTSPRNHDIEDDDRTRLLSTAG